MLLVLKLLSVLLTPMALSVLFEYLAKPDPLTGEGGFIIPSPFDFLINLIATFFILWIISFLLLIWKHSKKCGGPHKITKWGAIFKESLVAPGFSFIIATIINFIPVLKLPLMALEVLGDLIHPFFSKIPEGVIHLPGFIIGEVIALTVLKTKGC
tara:strand:- start:695 stop:1159 length:465 start_codon:yes stop_codon:yes gene_type:complete